MKKPMLVFLSLSKPIFKGVDVEVGNCNYLLIQLVPPIDHYIRKEIILHSINIYKYTIIILFLPLYGYLIYNKFN